MASDVLIARDRRKASRMALSHLLQARRELQCLRPTKFPRVTLRRVGEVVELLERAAENYVDSTDEVDPGDRAAVDRWVLGVDAGE